jgi:hypothetical protein
VQNLRSQPLDAFHLSHQRIRIRFDAQQAIHDRHHRLLGELGKFGCGSIPVQRVDLRIKALDLLVQGDQSNLCGQLFPTDNAAFAGICGSPHDLMRSDADRTAQLSELPLDLIESLAQRGVAPMRCPQFGAAGRSP